MPRSRKAVIQKQTRLFDDFFKIEEVIVSHERQDGTMSPAERRLVFERGDAVGIVLYNPDTKTVVMVDQFKVPTLIGRRRDDPNTADGWITEATAGMIDAGETPEQAVIRETREETGYQIENPKLICKFFSSPGGTSERIFLYFAEVRDSARSGPGGGLDGEDVGVVQMPLHELLDRLANGSIDDPKLAIGAFWLKDHVKEAADRERLVESLQVTVDDLFGRLAKGAIDNPRLAAAARWLQDHLPHRDHDKSSAAAAADNRPAGKPASSVLSYSTVCYELKDRPDLIVGYKTGPIYGIKGVSIWVNSENTDMLMDRIIGRTISSQIRLLGSNRDEDGNILEDTISEALRAAVGPRGHVKIGTVLVTESGSLRATHQVERILHVATVEASLGGGVKASLDRLAPCVETLLARAEKINNRGPRLFANLLRERLGVKPKYCETILIPMIGAGDGGLKDEEVGDAIVSAAINHLRNVKLPTLREVYFIAYNQRAKKVYDDVLERYCAEGTLVKKADK
jgi:nudix-type nucleoside diphosphatase (YffH/AdpP family)